MSMGMTAALKLRQVTINAELVLAIELMAAAEGIEYRAPLRSSEPVERARELIPEIRAASQRRIVRFPPDIEKLAAAIREGAFDTSLCETTLLADHVSRRSCRGKTAPFGHGSIRAYFRRTVN